MKTTLQVPITSDLKQAATQAAMAQGFSSLQEAVRVFLTQLSSKRISIGWSKTIKLSEKNDRRYNAMDKDFDNNKNVFTASSAQEFFEQLGLHDD